jgi:hypothetical protein
MSEGYIRGGGMKRLIMILMIIIFIIPVPLNAHVLTNRDTRMPPDYIEYGPPDTDGYTYLESIGYLEFYFRDDRDVFLIVDTRNGYSWKTGLDAAFNQDIDRAVQDARTPEDRLAAAVPREERLNATYIALANSVLTVELYDAAFNISLMSSASRTGAESGLVKVDSGYYRLDVEFTGIDLQIKVHVFLSGTGITVEIYHDGITGEGADRVASVILMPFLGAAGGSQTVYDPVTGRYGTSGVRKPMIPGYFLVPDGSGGLIRFRENTVSIRRYVGRVFGVNYAETMFYYSNEAYTVAKKEPLMPVFGAAHGNRQAAFAAWANSGAEHMEIIVSPHENTTFYNYIYPRFIINQQMHQVYNRRGDGYFRLFPDRLRYDISMTYHFLAGDGSTDGLPADYVGMALAYREHLINIGELTEKPVTGEMPIWIDFLMSDVRRSVVGTANVITATAEQVGGIIRDMQDNGMNRINAGLLGFQDGGITGGRPWTLNFTRRIGTRRDFEKLFAETGGGVDISFSQDYAVINRLQMRLPTNQAYHINRWGIRAYISHEPFVPVNEVSFARPSRSAEWIIGQTERARRIGAVSASVTGMTNILVSHYGDDRTTAAQAMELYRGAFERVSREHGMKINAETPNAFLWRYVDRFLRAPAHTTQYIIQTDTVPFLQLVLHGTMEVYAPYSNFSFYTQSDILRVIDYNMFPSFVITAEPAYLLSVTNSLSYYSTEYNLYRGIIKSVYDTVSETLSQVMGLRWVDRQVAANGVVVNTYEDGTFVVINYTESMVVMFDYFEVPPQSARLYKYIDWE